MTSMIGSVLSELSREHDRSFVGSVVKAEREEDFVKTHRAELEAFVEALAEEEARKSDPSGS